MVMPLIINRVMEPGVKLLLNKPESPSTVPQLIADIKELPCGCKPQGDPPDALGNGEPFYIGLLSFA